ncbi:histone-lysine N-methyltransferase SETMAR [Trichonephila clavipes]|nr:histone-lysine N-methyltransferase SETMAR [Trichonephila clavipes]
MTDSECCFPRGSVKKIEVTGQPSETRNFHQSEAPPPQCTISHLLRGYRALDKKWHRNNSTASLQPRLCPSRLFLFPKVKTALKGCQHRSLDDVKRACMHALKDVLVGDFQGAYESWKRHLQKYVHAQGAYFEEY